MTLTLQGLSPEKLDESAESARKALAGSRVSPVAIATVLSSQARLITGVDLIHARTVPAAV